MNISLNKDRVTLKVYCELAYDGDLLYLTSIKGEGSGNCDEQASVHHITI